MTVYATYLKAIGMLPWVFILILALAARSLDMGGSFWLSRWSDKMAMVESESMESMSKNDTTQNETVQSLNETATPTSVPNTPHLNQGFYLGIMCILGVFECKIF